MIAAVCGALLLASGCIAASDDDNSNPTEQPQATATPTMSRSSLATPTSSPTPTTPPPSHTAIPAPEALAYLHEALDIIEHNALHRDQIDWDEFRAEIVARAGDAQTPEDTHGAIRSALVALGDNHSRFFPPEFVEDFDHGDPNAPMPYGERIEGDVGYIFVPHLTSGGDVPERYMETAISVIAEIDGTPTCGWVIDLRYNGGGNMWPMLVALGPILGEGVVGYFEYPEGRRDAWTYYDGTSMMAGRVLASGPEYTLKRQMPPVAVLTDSRTGSSGEAVILAFRGRPDSRSFGEASGGFSTSNEPFFLSDGAWLNLTISRMADRNGTTFDGPIPSDVSRDELPAPPPGQDPDLLPALDWLQDEYGCGSG